MGDWTRCKGQYTMGSACGKSRLPLTVDGETHVIAVMPRFIAWHDLQHWWVCEASNVVQHLLHHGAFPRQLGTVLHVLQLAAAADAKNGARGRSSQGRGFMNFGDPDTRGAGLPAAAFAFPGRWLRRCLHSDGDALPR